MYEKGNHREVYHIGHNEEVSIRDLVELLAVVLGGELKILPTAAPEGGTSRRCPDVSKMRALGYSPKIYLNEGLRRTAEWYLVNRASVATNELM